MKIRPLGKKWRTGRGIFDDDCVFCKRGEHEICERTISYLCGCWKDKHEEDFRNSSESGKERQTAYARYTKGDGPDPREHPDWKVAQ